MPSELLTERRGTTLVLTISDPATRNTLSAQVIAAAIEALGVADGRGADDTLFIRGIVSRSAVAPRLRKGPLGHPGC